MAIGSKRVHIEIGWLAAIGLLLIAGLSPSVWAAETAPKEKEASQKAAPKLEGRLFKIALPITGRTFDQLRQSILRTIDKSHANESRLVLIFEFHVAKDQSEYGRGTKIGNAYDLADFLTSDVLKGARTFAYVPQSIQGHAVLAVLACQQIIMSPEAILGPAGVDEKRISQAVLANYREIASRHNTVPAEVAMKLVDPSRELVEVSTDVEPMLLVSGDWLTDPPKNRQIIRQKVLVAKDQPGGFSGSEARRLGFVKCLAGSRLELAQALELPPEVVTQDVAIDGQWRAVLVDLKGPIKARSIDATENVIQNAVARENANLVCLRIDSAGGSPVDSMRLVDFLVNGIDGSKVRTVAYVPKEARADAALVALACDHLVLGAHAVLGGEGITNFDAEEIRSIREMWKKAYAPKRLRSWSLPVAMFDSSLPVFRYTRRGEVGFYNDEELASLPQAAQWKKGEQVNTPGRVFLAEGEQTVDLRLANHVVNDFTQFKELYGLENDPTLLEQTWADSLIAALASGPAFTMLLIIACVAIYVELHTPGIGVAAFVALVCVVLIFWSHMLGGKAGWLEVLLFLAGLSCLALEVFVLPGVGIFGLGGGAMIIASLLLASQTFLIPRNTYQVGEFQNSLLMLAGAAVGTIAIITAINRYLPQTPMFSQMVLQPPSTEEVDASHDRASPEQLDYMVGSRGATITPLVPSGKARFGNQTLDVMTDGDFVSRGEEVEITQVHGNRVVVRPVRP